jgi:putative ABC transport system permease protein
MKGILKIGLRNLHRYKRRTILSSLIIMLGILIVILFIGVVSSFKKTMIETITDSTLGHIQIHKKGYLTTLDTSPLHFSVTPEERKVIAEKLSKNKYVEAFTYRIRFNAIISNYSLSANMRVMGIDPVKELATCPGQRTRTIGEPDFSQGFVKKGHIVLPIRLSRSMKIKVGDTVVIVATNKDGSVNALNFKVQAFTESIMGPGGRDGYIHLDDTFTLLRTVDVVEIPIRIKDIDDLKPAIKSIKKDLPKGIYDINPWSDFSSFATIATVIDLMLIFLRILLIAIVTISVMNVMMMAVYERTREIGTLSAMGTKPKHIMGMFYSEAFFMGLFSSIAGALLGVGLLLILRSLKLTFKWHRSYVILSPSISFFDVLILVAVVIAFTVLATIIPARKAKKLEPVEALRFV